jgi:hypothetical protein
VERHAEAAATSCPSLASKVVSPHVLRHTAAMRLLHAGVDVTVIALWLRHESIETTQMHVHADLTLKEKAFARITPIESAPARYRPPDTTRPTPSSRSSRRSDYVDIFTTRTAYIAAGIIFLVGLGTVLIYPAKRHPATVAAQAVAHAVSA